MTYHDDPAFARTAHMTDGGTYTSKQDGLTKREYFAAMAMQGILAASELADDGVRFYLRHVNTATMAVKMADDLIDELNKSDEE